MPLSNLIPFIVAAAIVLLAFLRDLLAPRLLKRRARKAMKAGQIDRDFYEALYGKDED